MRAAIGQAGYMPALLGTCLVAAVPAYGQDEAHECVLEAKATIELQSAEDGILERILVTRGDRVAAGEIVAELDSEQEAYTAERARIRAETDTVVTSARAEAEYRRSEAERLGKLRVNDSISERDVAAAEIEARLADIQLERAIVEHEISQIEYRQTANLLDRRSIRSPVDGVIVDITMAPGEFVHEQAMIMTIAELDPLYVEMFLPVTTYGSIEAGMMARVEPEAPIGGVYDAAVAVVDNVFDAASRTYRVRLLLPNQDYAIPAGLRCTVTFPN